LVFMGLVLLVHGVFSNASRNIFIKQIL